MLGKLEGFLQNMMVLYVLFLSPYNRIEINNKPLSNDYAQSSDCIFFWTNKWEMRQESKHAFNITFTYQILN